MLFDPSGNRKYLTRRERLLFIKAARRFPPKVETFCLTLAFTGCRISEALALTPSRLDYDGRVIIFETIKRRRRGVYRAVPAPDFLLARLKAAHTDCSPLARLWSWSRTTAWKRIKEVMEIAGIDPPRAMPKALRHAVGVIGTTEAGIALNLIQKWLGHARIQTTAIYADAVGPEERAMAAKMWDTLPDHFA